MHQNVVALVLAGGMGSRLQPLTEVRAKPAVPFGGKYRIIDFTLNNFVNSGIRKIKVLTQYKSDSLLKHLKRGWTFLPSYLDEYVDPVPAQMRTGAHWYLGTADAVYQNLNLLDNEQPDYVCVFSGDHVYKMDISQMLAYHWSRGADMVVAVNPMPVEQAAGRFGVIEVDENGAIVGFEEKPENPTPLPHEKGHCLVSMGNYTFRSSVLREEVARDAADEASSHDFGKDVIPSMVGRRKLFAYDFSENKVPGEVRGLEGNYWRDVGTIDAYWEANMDLVSITPKFNLYNRAWPLRSANRVTPPPKLVSPGSGSKVEVENTIISGGSILTGCRVHNSVLGYRVVVERDSLVSHSIISDDVIIGSDVVIEKAIVDKGVNIPSGTIIGLDKDKDRERFTVSPGGITIVPKGCEVGLGTS